MGSGWPHRQHGKKLKNNAIKKSPQTTTGRRAEKPADVSKQWPSKKPTLTLFSGGVPAKKKLGPKIEKKYIENGNLRKQSNPKQMLRWTFLVSHQTQKPRGQWPGAAKLKKNLFFLKKNRTFCKIPPVKLAFFLCFYWFIFLLAVSVLTNWTYKFVYHTFLLPLEVPHVLMDSPHQPDGSTLLTNGLTGISNL